VVAAYCTDHPVRSTVAEPRLNSSMKSFLKVDPAFPPPPYTWLTTTWAWRTAARAATCEPRSDG
jgi:hypothetical protein